MTARLLSPLAERLLRCLTPEYQTLGETAARHEAVAELEGKGLVEVTWGRGPNYRIRLTKAGSRYTHALH